MEASEPVVENQTDQAVIQVLEETTRLRRLRSRISGGAAFTILLLLIFLFADMISFVKSYDTAAVVEEMKEKAPRLMDSLQMKTLMNSIRKEILPKYVNELSRKLADAEPVLRSEGEALLSGISTNIGPAIQKKIVADLNGIMVETQALLKEKYPQLTDAEIRSILELMQVEVEKQYTERIAEQVSGMFGDLNKAFDDLKKTETYATLEKMDTADLEKMLLTTSLELLIYEIDPAEGAKLKEVSND